MKTFWIPFWTIFLTLTSVFIFIVYKIKAGRWLNVFEGILLIVGSMIGILLLVFVSGICAVHLEDWYRHRQSRRP